MCQICQNIGHSARECSYARFWFGLKNSFTSTISNTSISTCYFIFPKLISDTLGTGTSHRRLLSQQMNLIQNNSVVQTHEIIVNINLIHLNTPIVNLTFANQSVPALVDISVPLISIYSFDLNKNSFTHWHRSCSVKISTLNSKVHFVGCIKVSFKINNAYYTNPRFINECSPNSKFYGLINFHFIKKYNLIIIPDIEYFKIK